MFRGHANTIFIAMKPDNIRNTAANASLKGKYINYINMKENRIRRSTATSSVHCSSFSKISIQGRTEGWMAEGWGAGGSNAIGPPF